MHALTQTISNSNTSASCGGESMFEVISDHAAAAVAAVITDSTDNINTTAVKSKGKASIDTVTYVKRFGHTLTKIGAKSLVLIGGSSLDNCYAYDGTQSGQ